MYDNLLFDELVYLENDSIDAFALFGEIVPKLEKMGYVNDGYLSAIIEREREYPTGLPSTPYQVAIPHADPQYVKKPGIVVIRANSTIDFKEMGLGKGDINAKYVFILILDEGKLHIDLLQDLINFFMDQKKMELLDSAKTSEEIIKVLKNNLTERS